MHRRGFFGWLLGGAASAAIPPKEPITEQKVVSLPNGWTVTGDKMEIQVTIYEGGGKTTAVPIELGAK